MIRPSTSFLSTDTIALTINAPFALYTFQSACIRLFLALINYPHNTSTHSRTDVLRSQDKCDTHSHSNGQLFYMVATTKTMAHSLVTFSRIVEHQPPIVKSHDRPRTMGVFTKCLYFLRNAYFITRGWIDGLCISLMWANLHFASRVVTLVLWRNSALSWI